MGGTVAAGLTSLFVPLSSAFLTSGVVPGFTGVVTGEPVGAGVVGTVEAVGAGVAGLTWGFGVSQAPNTAVETAKTVVKIIDLFIVTPRCSRNMATRNSRTRGRPLALTLCSRTDVKRLSANLGESPILPPNINTALDRTRDENKLAQRTQIFFTKTKWRIEKLPLPSGNG